MLQNPLDLHISRRLKTIRTMSGMTQMELASLIGITSQQINKYENGINKMHASRLYEISQLLGKPLASFFEGYKDNDNYYNFEFKAEKEQSESDEIKNKELTNLVKSFNQINNFEVRNTIIALLSSIAQLSS